MLSILRLQIKIGIVLVFLITPLVLDAQFVYLKSGLNLNSARVSEIESNENLPTAISTGLNNFVFGAGYGIEIKNKVYVQLGLDWTVRGYVNKFSEEPWERNQFWRIYEDFQNHKVRTRLHYIGIPITASYYIDINDLKFYIQSGAFFNFGISGREVITGSFQGKNREEYLSSVFKSIASQHAAVPKNRGDLGLIFGAGIMLDEFQIGLQYLLSTKNIARSDYDLRNRTLSVVVLLNLNLKS